MPPSISDLSKQIQDEAYRTAFALMKANYVERRAPEMPSGVIHGLETHARDVAVRLRDSISARFNSLAFHQGLLAQVDSAHQKTQHTQNDVEAQAQAILTRSWQAHFLFDDLIFNAASLCDYLGNAVWFGFHGANYINKKWKSTYDAAKRPDAERNLPRGPRIHGSRTGAVIVDAHIASINDLYGYRSELIHYSIDGPNVYSHTFWEDRADGRAGLPVPYTFSRRLSRLLGRPKEESRSLDIVSGGAQLVHRMGEITLATLTALREDMPGGTDATITMLL